LYALNKVNQTWTSKTDDFFPYAHVSHSFFTGYFTSRAALKLYERYSNNILQVTRQLNALSNVNMRNSLFLLSEITLIFLNLFFLTHRTGEAMGLIQHHDAISGTERQHVADDYVQRLSQGIDAAIVSDRIR
jgi:lysosomal alpha-mannosidase